jgi:hypothetical protein
MATYKYKDFTYSQEEIEEKVDTLDISFEDYLIKNDIKKVEEEEEVVEASSPVVEEDFQTDTAVGADVVSTDVPALDTNTELDSVDISSVSSDPDPKIVLTQQEFDSILPEGNEVPNEDKITESLNSMFRGKGVGVEVDIPIRPGADVITLTNIETGATTEIPLYTDVTGDTFGSRNRIKNPEAYSEIANFLANQPKTDGYVGNVYKNTGIAPENYFTEETDRSPNMDSISSQIELSDSTPSYKFNAEQMNAISDSSSALFINAFKDPKQVGLNLEDDRIANFNYSDDEMNQLIDEVYKDAVTETGLNFSKRDFVKLYGTKSNLVNTFKRTAQTQQTIDNNYRNNLDYTVKQRDEFKTEEHKIRLKNTDQFETKLYEINNSILTTNKKLTTLKSQLLQGPSEEISKGDNFDEDKWYESINSDIEKEEDNLSVYRKDVTTNAELAAKEYAKSQERVVSMGDFNRVVGYKEAYDEKYKELTELNYVGGDDAFTRAEKRKAKGNNYNAGFDSIQGAFSDYLAGIKTIDSTITNQEGAILFADTKYTEKLDILTDARNENIKFKFDRGYFIEGFWTNQDKRKSELSNAGFVADKNGYYNMSVFEAKELGYDLNTLGNVGVKGGIEISEDELNKIKIFQDNLETVDGELDAVWETLYLNKDIENIKSDSNFRIFGNAAMEAITDKLGINYDGDGSMQLKRNIEALNSEYNEVYARDIIDGKMPAAQFTPEQLKSLETTFGEDFAEMAGGFVPLFGEIMALTAVAGGAMNYLGAAKWIQKALSSNTASAWEKLSATMVTGGIEEAKMRLLGFPPGTGAIFGVSGVLAKGVRITNSIGGQSVMDPFFQNTVKTAVMGVTASEASHVLEKYVEDLKGNENFMASFDELYGDFDEVGQRVALNGLLFASTGVFHIKGTDFIGTNQINKTITELYTKRIALTKEGRFTGLENKTLETVDRKLTNKEKKLVKSYDQSINSLQKVVELRNGGALISIDDPNLQKTLQTKSMDPITNLLKKGGGNIKSSVLTVVSDAKVAREKLWDADKGVEVPARFNDLGNGRYEILVNKRLANKMIEEGSLGSIQDLVSHEMVHYVRSVTTKKFPGSQPRIVGNVMNRIPKMDGLGKGGLRRFKKMMEKAYEENGVAMSEVMSQEEQLAYVVQIFSKPELYYTAEAPTFISEVIKDIKYNFSLVGYKGNPPTNNKQLASYFFEALREMKNKKAEKFVDMLAPEMKALENRNIQFVERGNGTIGIVVDEKTTQRDSKLIEAEETAVKKESYVVTNELFKDRKGWNNGKPTKEFLKTLENEKDKALILKAAQPVIATSMKRLYTRTLQGNRNDVTYEQFKKDIEQEYYQRFLDYDILKVGKNKLTIAEQTSNLYNLRINKLGTEQFKQTSFTSSIDNLTISEERQVQQGYGETFKTSSFENLDLSPGSAGRSGVAKTNKKINVLDGPPTIRLKDNKGDYLPLFKPVIEKGNLDFAGVVLNPGFKGTFKSVNDLARKQGFSGELLGKMTGIDANAIRNSNKNFNNKNQKLALKFLLDPANLKWSLRTMQEANTPVKTVLLMGPKGNPVVDKIASKNSGKTVFKTKLIGGMPTGIPRNIRDLLYEFTGQEVNGNPQYRLKRSIDLKEIYNAIGITDGKRSVDLQGQGSRTTSESGKAMQTLKGFMTQINQAMNVKQAQDVGRKMGIDLQVIENMGKGKSRFVDSKDFDGLKQVLIDEVKTKGGIGGQKISEIVVNTDNIEADTKQFLITEIAKDGVISSRQKDAWVKIIENNEKIDFENSGLTDKERVESEVKAAKSTKELAESLFKEGYINRVANTSTAEVQKTPALQEAQRNFDVEVLKNLPSLSTLPSSSIRSIIKTLQHGTKSRKNVDGTYKSQKLNEVLDFYGIKKDGKTSDINYELVKNPKTGKMEGKYDAVYISDFKKADFYKENKRLHDLVDSGKLTEIEAKTKWKEWSENKLSAKGYTYSQTKQANEALAQDFINGMYETVRKAGTKEGGEFSWTPEAKQAMEMVVLTMGNQTSIAQGLIKAGFYNVESVAWNLSKPEFSKRNNKGEKLNKNENFNEGEAGYWEHEKQLLNTSRDVVKNMIKNISNPEAFEIQQNILSQQAVQSFIPKNTQLRNDGKKEGGLTGYGELMPTSPSAFTNFNRNTFKNLTEAGNQIKLGETETISIADGLFNSMNTKQRINTLNLLSKSSNLNTTGIILKGKLQNVPMVKEVQVNNFELIKLANEKLPFNSTTPEILRVLKEKDNKIAEEIKQSNDSKDLSVELNKIIRNGSTEVRNYSSAQAALLGKKIKDDIWIPSSAEDFKGLIYRTLGKGKEGEQQFAWYKENLIDPLNKAENLASVDTRNIEKSWLGLKKQLKNVPKQLRKNSDVKGFTNENAIRIYNWARQGMEVPGLSKQNLKDVINYVDANPEFVAFSDKLIEMAKGDGYPPPTEMWLTGTMGTDLRSGLGSVKRAKYLEATGFTNNIDQIYSKQNLNNLEAKYGTKYRVALENMITRVKSGRNRKPSKNEWENRMADWLNGANAVTMSLNVKSGVMQLTSSINYLNASDNNPIAAGMVIGNLPVYSAAVRKIWKSDYLQDRMGGDKIDVSQNEVAEAAKSNGIKGLTNLILQKGYIVTRAADAAAIASGGATFLVNRTKTYKKQGMSEKEAGDKAFEDFRLISEQTQQSAATSMLSSEQASISGRAILAFNNTPAQYTRITKRAVEDLMAGRGSKGENIRKIIYYSVAQNLLFNGMSNAMFGDIWETDEQAANPNVQKRKQDRNIRTVNGMLDTMLRGSGIKGAAVSTLKNMLIKVYNENKKKRPDYAEVALEALDFVPSLDTKIRKLRAAGNAISWNYKDIKKLGLMDSKNPAYLASSNVISAATNFPADRLLMKFNNMRAVMTEDMEGWQKISRALGWSEYAVGPYKDFKKSRSSKKSGFEDSFDFSSDFNSGNDDFNSDFN